MAGILAGRRSVWRLAIVRNEKTWQPHKAALKRDPPMVSVKRPKGELADFEGLSVLVRVEKGFAALSFGVSSPGLLLDMCSTRQPPIRACQSWTAPICFLYAWLGEERARPIYQGG